MATTISRSGKAIKRLGAKNITHACVQPCAINSSPSPPATDQAHASAGESYSARGGGRRASALKIAEINSSSAVWPHRYSQKRTCPFCKIRNHCPKVMHDDLEFWKAIRDTRKDQACHCHARLIRPTQDVPNLIFRAVFGGIVWRIWKAHRMKQNRPIEVRCYLDTDRNRASSNGVCRLSCRDAAFITGQIL